MALKRTGHCLNRQEKIIFNNSNYYIRNKSIWNYVFCKSVMDSLKYYRVYTFTKFQQFNWLEFVTSLENNYK